MDVLTELQNSCHSAEIKLYPNAFKYFCYSKSFPYKIVIGKWLFKVVGEHTMFMVLRTNIYYTAHKELSYMHITCVWQLPI